VSANSGSGILCQGGAVLESLVVSGNTDAGIEVGGLVFDSLAEVRNSLLVGNGGAGLSVRAEGYGFLVNSTLSGNAGAGISGDAYAGYIAGIEVANSILWDNALGSFVLLSGATAAAQHSLVAGGWPGAGNIDQAPLFVDPLGGDYRLLFTSPCIDAGDNTAVPPGLTTDLRGAPRFIDDPLTPDSGVGAAPVVDMGAYEFFRRFRDARGVPVTPAPPRTVP
jgi:hypothetical protein